MLTSSLKAVATLAYGTYKLKRSYECALAMTLRLRF